MDKQFQVFLQSQQNYSIQQNQARKKKLNHRSLITAQFNMVCVRGVLKKIAQSKIFCSIQMMGQYGNIVNFFYSDTKKSIRPNQKNILTCFVVYDSIEAATLAQIAINNMKCNNKKMVAFYGFTKYCEQFISNRQCQFQNCRYLHYWQDSKYCFQQNSKDEKQQAIQQMKQFRNFIFDQFLKTDYNLKPNLFSFFNSLYDLRQQYTTQDQKQKRICSSFQQDNEIRETFEISDSYWGKNQEQEEDLSVITKKYIRKNFYSKNYNNIKRKESIFRNRYLSLEDRNSLKQQCHNMIGSEIKDKISFSFSNYP